MLTRFIILLFLIVPTLLIGQSIGINNTGTSPDPSSMLDVSSSDKGILVPRMSTASRTAISSPATSLLVFDTTTDSFWFYNGTAWEELSAKITEVFDEDHDTGIDVELGTDPDRIYFYLNGGVASYTMRENENGVARLETQDNILIGKLSGAQLAPSGVSSGSRNIYIGNEVGEDAISTTNNVGIGYQAMEEVTTGSQNTAVGQSALENATTAGSNAAFGQAALSEPGIGSSNTGIGTRAGQNNAGSSNTFVGALAGNNSSGNGNVLIGNQAGSTASGGNKLYIDNSSTNSPLIYGEFDNNKVRINGELNVNGNYTLPLTGGSPGAMMLAGGASGTASWSSFVFPTTYGSNGQILKRNSGNSLVWSVDEVNDADSNPSNELQMLSISGDNLTLSNGNTITIPSDGIWTESASDIYYQSGKVAIGNSLPSNRFEVTGAPINSELVDFSSTALTSNQDLLNLNIAVGSNDNSQVIEATRGTENLFKLNGNGQLILNDSSPEGDYALTVQSISGETDAIYTEGNSTLVGDNLFQGDNLFEGETTMSGQTKFRGLSGTSHEIGIYPDNVAGAIGKSELFLAGDMNGIVGHTISNDSSAMKILYSTIVGDVTRLRVDNLGKWTFNEGAFVMNPNASGDSRFITDELEIRGGSDLAEKFDINTTIIPEPGMLVSIDKNSPGKLIITKDANDPLLAGVISGANGIDPGMLMGQKGTIADGDYPITLTGRVYVKANDEGGIIGPGDLICSSSTKGESMKASAELKLGACLGKALSGKDAQGYILVLVSVR